MSIKYTSFVYDEANQQWVQPMAGADYDLLTNQPVKNANGSSAQNYVNIAGLDFGRYVVRGYYKYATAEDTLQATIPLDLVVTEDDEQQKVAIFPTVEQGVCITNVITYTNDGTMISHSKQAPGVTYWKPFT